MNLIISPTENKIIVDGELISSPRMDLSWVPSNVYAVGWCDTHGQIEYNDGTFNEKITELGIYEQAISVFELEKQRFEDERIAREIEIEASRDYWSELRSIRNYKLSQSDWTQFIDSPLDENQKNTWQIYRQQLRDLPNNITDPKPLVLDDNHSLWPVNPT